MLQERLARLPPQPGLEHPAVIGERDALLLLTAKLGYRGNPSPLGSSGFG
jgi:hypothetical protein